MNLGTRLRVGVVLAAVLLLVGACTSSTADGPTSSSATSVTATPSVIDPSSLGPSPTPSSPPSPSPSVVEPMNSGSIDPADREAVDRAAIEAQWIRFWDSYRDMIRTPDEERERLLSKVVTSPLKETMINEARNAQAAGHDNYGTVLHRVFWDIPVDGSSVATIADCQDQTGTGIVDVASGQKLSEGVDRIEIRGQMIEGEDGIWRVQALFESGDARC